MALKLEKFIMSQLSKKMLPIVSDPDYSLEKALAAENELYEACSRFSVSQVKREAAEITNVSHVREQTLQLAEIKDAITSCIINGVEVVIDAVEERFQYRSCVFSLRYDGHIQYLEQTDSFVSPGIKVIDSIIAPSFKALGA